MTSQQAPAVLVDTPAGIVSLIDSIMKLPVGAPNLFLDLEGISLSRHGSLSIVTIYVRPEARAYLVDVHTLGSAAFSTPHPGRDGVTLETILESPLITKVFFDVRNDSDALFFHYGVDLKGVEDVQLMENASRQPGSRKFIMGLEKTIQRYAPLSIAQKSGWSAAKERGLRLFHPSKGGTYEVFNHRPLNPDVVKYCVNDVQFLPMLRDQLWALLGPEWKANVKVETENRVRESQSEGYEPQSRDKTYGPWEKDSWPMR